MGRKVQDGKEIWDIIQYLCSTTVLGGNETGQVLSWEMENKLS